MDVKFEADFKHTRKPKYSDKWFMVKIQVKDNDGNFVGEGEVGSFNEYFNDKELKKELNDIWDADYSTEIISHIEFKNKEQYDEYKKNKINQK